MFKMIKLLFIGLGLGLFIASCTVSPQPAVVVQPNQPAVVATQPYQVMTDASGNQIVYYTDPYSHASYYLEYALFMSMWNSPNRYYTINHYYVGHRDYITSRQSYYRSTYNRPYRPSSPTLRRSAPLSNGYNRTGRTSSPQPFTINRSSSPSRSNSPSTYHSSSSSSSYRSSSPSRRH